MAAILCLRYSKRAKRKQKDGENRKAGETAQSAIAPMLLSFVLGIGVCCFCLVGGTYAWYSASIATPTQTLQSANYDITVKITDSGSVAVTPESDGGYSLNADISYTVTLTATGTATTGYCKITVGDTESYTGQIKQGATVEFTLTPAANGTYFFKAVWGTYAGNPDIP